MNFNKIFLLVLSVELFQSVDAKIEPAEAVTCLERLIEKAKSELAKEEAQIMQEFFGLAKINPNQWEKLKNSRKPELLNEDQAYLAKHCTLLPNNLLRKELESILRENDIDPATVLLVSDPDQLQSPAHIQTNTLCVNADVVQNWTPAGLKLIIYHEIQHLKHDDWLVAYALKKYLIEKNPSVAEVFLKKAHHFGERRADILGILSYARSNNVKELKSDDLKCLACGYTAVTTKNKDQYGMAQIRSVFHMNDDADTHPGSKTRLTYFDALLKKVAACDNKSCMDCNSEEAAKSNWFQRFSSWIDILNY